MQASVGALELESFLFSDASAHPPFQIPEPRTSIFGDRVGCGRGGGGLGSSGRGRMTPGSNSFVNGHQTFMINTPQGQMISPMQRRLGRVLQPQPENIPTTPVSQGLFNEFLMFKRMQKMASMSGQF